MNKRHTKKDLESLKEKLDQAKQDEGNVINKYSDNFSQWSKACDKVNRLKNKYNKMLAEFRYDNGSIVFGSVFVGKI